MSNYKNIESMINRIHAVSDEEVEQEIESMIYDNQVDERQLYYFFATTYLFMVVPYFISYGFSLRTILASILLLVFASPLAFLIAYGVYYGITKPFSSLNFLKSKKLRYEYKKLNIRKIIKENDFENADVKFFNKIGISLDRYKFISDGEINEISRKIDTMPSFIRAKMKEKIVSIMMEGRKLRKSDQNMIEKIIQLTKKIQDENEKSTHFIEMFHVGMQKEKKGENDNLTLKLKSLSDKQNI